MHSKTSLIALGADSGVISTDAFHRTISHTSLIETHKPKKNIHIIYYLPK